jgi:hypothetical protein
MPTLNRYLTSDPNGPKGILANFQHATDVFVENYYRLAPKYKFLFYAYFEFDSSVASISRSSQEISLLVKTTSLPSFSYDTVTKNKYNRKRVVYKGINYDPITLTIHDDNEGIMNAVYKAYNEYFSNDPAHANSSAWEMNNKWTGLRYGMDVDTPVRFIKRISLYTLSRQRYQGYTLWGPKIKSWKHGDVDYSAGADVIESSMTVEYEGVTYDSGAVSEGTPDGFASIHYDHVPSPLTTGGGPNAGGGGDANTIFNVAATDPMASPPNFLSNSIAAQQQNRAIPLPTGQLPADFLNVSNPNTSLGIDLASDPFSDISVVANRKQVNQQINDGAFPVQFGGGNSLAPTFRDLEP